MVKAAARSKRGIAPKCASGDGHPSPIFNQPLEFDPNIYFHILITSDMIVTTRDPKLYFLNVNIISILSARATERSS